MRETNGRESAGREEWEKEENSRSRRAIEREKTTANEDIKRRLIVKLHLH